MEDEAPERRDARRRSVLLAGAIVHSRRQFPCRIHDVSTTGLQVQIDAPLPPGTPVHAEIARYGRFPAIVAWVDGQMMGLVFPEGAAGGLARLGEAAITLGLVDPPAADADPLGGRSVQPPP